MRHLVIYDISDDKTRMEVFKTLKRYGAWKQYSAFELDLTRTQKAELKIELKELISKEENIRIYRICGNCEEKVEELGRKIEESSSTVV